MSYTCSNCGHVGSSSRKLSDWEIAELRREVERVRAEPSANPWKSDRQTRLRYIAADYGINIRTLYRYLRDVA